MKRDDEFNAETYVPQRVANQAIMHPNSVAVASADRQLTYSELNTRAEELAAQLRSVGVGPDVPVALCIQSSIEMVVGALGILKAGGAYLPLDPAYPEERLSFILRDSQTPVLLTAARCTADSLADAVRHIIVLDPRDQAALCLSTTFRSVSTEIIPDNLAYVIYTSGSTGVPKGVQITHGSLSNLIRWYQEAFAITPADRGSQLAGISFDAAVWELWPYLSAGASVHIADDAVRGNAVALQDWLLSRKITVSFIPTVMAERIMALDWPAKAALRTVLTGGETLHKYPRTDLPFAVVNNYGPTECTVAATSGPVAPGDEIDQRPSIGRPAANARVYILDGNLRQVPVGTRGEIYIGGPGLARGYLNRPELTAQKFIADAFSQAPGARLYRTGDIACYQRDGQIAFLGRIDDQIKIHGYRIEPNEVVFNLTLHPSVLESAVAVRETGAGEKQLIAYCVLAPEARPTDTELRTFLRLRLPEFMIPAAFVRIGQLPLTRHGKVDRSALPEPTRQNTIADDTVAKPLTVVEERLAGVLETLLSVKGIGSDDNFFHLGGHSMLGAQLVARVRERFGVELSLRSLFDHPTVRGMSAEIERLILEQLEPAAGEPNASVLTSPEVAQ